MKNRLFHSLSDGEPVIEIPRDLMCYTAIRTDIRNYPSLNRKRKLRFRQIFRIDRSFRICFMSFHRLTITLTFTRNRKEAIVHPLTEWREDRIEKRGWTTNTELSNYLSSHLTLCHLSIYYHWAAEKICYNNNLLSKAISTCYSASFGEHNTFFHVERLPLWFRDHPREAE